MINYILLTLFILVIIIILYQAVSFLTNKNNHDEDKIPYETEIEETIYNESPIQWLRLDYNKVVLPHYIHNENGKNIVIIEPSLVFQRIYFDLLKDKYNLYFFDDGQTFVDAYKNKQFTIIPNLFILSNHCNIVNGVHLYRLHQKHKIEFKDVPHIITSTNKMFHVDGDYLFIGKPFDNEFMLKQIEKVLN